MSKLCETCIGNEFCTRFIKSKITNHCHKYKAKDKFIDSTQSYFSVYYLRPFKHYYGVTTYVHEEMKFNSKMSAINKKDILELEREYNERNHENESYKQK